MRPGIIICFIYFLSGCNSIPGSDKTAAEQMDSTFVINLIRRLDSAEFSVKGIPVGLLIREKEIGDRFSLSARLGAELAIKKANEKGGINSQQVHLITRPIDGPWGVTSREVVNMIYMDSVYAIIGSLDGRNAHLAEQVITKQHVVLVSAWSSEQTLTQAFVPWFFRIVPDDRSQCEILLNAIYNEKKLRNILVIAEDEYDTRMAAVTFNKTAGQYKDLKIERYSFIPGMFDSSGIIEKIEGSETKAIILFCQPDFAAKIIRIIRDKDLKMDIFGHISVFSDGSLLNLSEKYTQNLFLVSPEFYFTQSGFDFIVYYKKAYQIFPDATAAYAYDAVSAIIESIRRAGSDRQAIRDTLALMHIHEGITGQIRFNERGNRQDTVKLMEINSGKAIPLH